MSTNTRRIVFFLVIAVLAILSGLYAWQQSRPAALPAGFVAGNGRIESTEIDIATRSAGRVKEILCREGDFVEAGQIVARMDTQTLEAELHQLQAKVKQAESASSASIASQKLDAKAGAIALVEQRRQAKTTALAAVAQSESEVAFAESELQRSEELVAKGFITAQRLQGDKTKLEIARASLDAARSKVAEAQAAIAAAQSPALETQPAIAAYESQVSESESSIEAAIAATEKIKADMADATLRSPRAGRVQYRTAEPGEVLPAGGKLLTIVDLSDVGMTFFLPESVAGKLAIGSEVRLVLDAVPQYVIPAKVSFVDSTAQFTPKAVETTSERRKLVFRSKAQIDPELLRKYRTQVKTGLPGVAYVRLEATLPWPQDLQVKLPQ
ncbi:MAG: HlyD family efflux transporter periplasmic adaptor subunit [Candidatus Accumulibacter phosphatis]|jgi:HlyD family secretion protein|uniref:HlyD family efflux transporter periplasmic adaptor subunit n=1 Tax=Candidatus Accumulibacter contiguus TaxID=2954381 RepID=A0ABX1T7M1_9PROT|nr:HlyD family efflux transporter periplasmic adaptor subunit [Candidatus Accumulibacter contiguus]MBL8406877.1 HlyD family efflux transporter periplasmic adaptor subunit [Accumulibacter sp.]NMQ05659.1 HlyD family efflux transporter periplasmic adaptor subunit [Candidatus Accumulibacter contiguus]